MAAQHQSMVKRLFFALVLVFLRVIQCAGNGGGSLGWAGDVCKSELQTRLATHRRPVHRHTAVTTTATPASAGNCYHYWDVVWWNDPQFRRPPGGVLRMCQFW